MPTADKLSFSSLVLNGVLTAYIFVQMNPKALKSNSTFTYDSLPVKNIFAKSMANQGYKKTKFFLSKNYAEYYGVKTCLCRKVTE